MRLAGQLTILCDRDKDVEIVVEDRDASVTVAKVIVTKDMFVAALGRMGCVDCALWIGPAEFFGKRLEVKSIVANEMPSELCYGSNEAHKAWLEKWAKQHEVDGWIADCEKPLHSKSKSTVHFRRWVDKKAESKTEGAD